MPNDEIRARIEAFVSDLSEAMRKAAVEAVKQALGGAEPAPKAAGGRGRPAKAAPRKAAPARKAGPAKKAAKRAPGQKRDPKELEQLVEKLAAHIASHPGERIEQINKALGIPTKDLTLPIKKLLKAKRITSKGQKRSTAYYPAASGAKGAAKKGKGKAAEGAPDGKSE